MTTSKELAQEREGEHPGTPLWGKHWVSNVLQYHVRWYESLMSVVQWSMAAEALVLYTSELQLCNHT